MKPYKPTFKDYYNVIEERTRKYKSKLPKIDLEEMEKRKLGQSRKKLLALLEEMK
jgi:hypothetical protein